MTNLPCWYLLVCRLNKHDQLVQTQIKANTYGQSQPWTGAKSPQGQTTAVGVCSNFHRQQNHPHRPPTPVSRAKVLGDPEKVPQCPPLNVDHPWEEREKPAPSQHLNRSNNGAHPLQACSTSQWLPLDNNGCPTRRWCCLDVGPKGLGRKEGGTNLPANKSALVCFYQIKCSETTVFSFHCH